MFGINSDSGSCEHLFSHSEKQFFLHNRFLPKIMERQGNTKVLHWIQETNTQQSKYVSKLGYSATWLIG